MRPPGFIVKPSSDLCPNILLRIRFRFLFSTLFSRDPPPFPTMETRKYGYRCRLLAVGFSPFFAITRQMDLLLRVSQNGNNRGFPNVLCAFKKRAQATFYHYCRYASDILLVSIFIQPCDRSHRAVRLDSDFASEKCANACGAREHPPSTQTLAHPSFSRRCCDIAGSVYGPRLSDIRRRVR